MTESIELHDSDVAAVEIVEGTVRIEFSDAYIWAQDKGWGQRALLTLENGQVHEMPAEFPVTISEGMLSGGEEQYDNIVPLPFSEHGAFAIEFSFNSGESLKVTGHNPRVELIGERRFIEDAGQL
jgi:hypothetical protein